MLPYLVTDFRRPTAKPKSRKDLIAYLSGHPRYHTGNSWNDSTSYSRCIKLRHISFPDKGVRDAAWELVCSDTDWWRAAGLKQEVRDFDERHRHLYQLGVNGRSGGYVVMYQGCTEPSGVKSYCEDCGQPNYTRADPEPGRCGKCGAQARVNHATEPVRIVTWPYRSFDQDAYYADWDKESLKDRAALVWDLDDTVERMAAKFIEFCKTHTVGTKQVMVPTTVQVLTPR